MAESVIEDDIDAKDWACRELRQVIHQLEFVASGLAVQRAGIVWYLPLCHDAYGENI